MRLLPAIFYLLLILTSCKTVQKQHNTTAKPSADIPFFPLQTEQDLDPLITAIGGARVVLLGESTHGSAEFYTWRAAISKRLITEKNFNAIVVEGDWHDLYAITQFLTHASADSADLYRTMKRFSRWQETLWANQEFASFVLWLHNFNKSTAKKVGVFGMDVFAFSKAINDLKLLIKDSTTLKRLRTVEQCLQPFGTDALQYSAAVAQHKINCNGPVHHLWLSLQKLIPQEIKSENDLVLEQNAALLKSGETYFRLRNTELAISWNGRVQHMMETIGRLLQFYGSNSKIIVWAHNTHVGDAKYTDMHNRDRTNIGEQLRKELGEKNVFITGFGTYKGEILGAYKWGEPLQKIQLQAPKVESVEAVLHRDMPVNKVVFAKDIQNHRQLSWIIQRAIGVVYSENYVPTNFTRRYDAFVFIDSTTAIHPMK